MIQVYVELSNIQWECDEDGDIKYEQGTDRCFVADIPDHCNMSSEDVNEAIADSLENLCGYRPKSWTLLVFDDTEEEDSEEEREQQRRDEKNGLYPDKWDDAN